MTYTALATNVAHSTSNRVYLQVFKNNTTTLRIYRITMINMGTAGVAGVLPQIIVSSISSPASGGSPVAITPYRRDSTQSTITSGEGGWTINSLNTSNGTIVNQYYSKRFSSGEFAASTAKIDNFLANPSLAVIWDAGYGSNIIEPLTIPSGEAGGIMVHSPGIASATGVVDVMIEFTVT